MYSYSEIVNELLIEFPEISGRYAGELAWIQDTFQGQETRGQTICFDRCFCDYIGRLLVSGHQDNVKIKQVFERKGMFAEHRGAAYQICEAEILSADHFVSLSGV